MKMDMTTQMNHAHHNHDMTTMNHMNHMNHGSTEMDHSGHMNMNHNNMNHNMHMNMGNMSMGCGDGMMGMQVITCSALALPMKAEAGYGFRSLQLVCLSH